MTHQPSESLVRLPFLLLWTAPWVLVGHRALGIKLVAACEAPPLHAADDQGLGALQAVTTPFIPKVLKMVTSLAGRLLPAKAREAAVKKRTTPKWTRVRQRPRAMNRRCPRVKTSRSAHTPRTPLTGVSQLFGEHENTDPESNSKDKVRLHGKGSTRTAPRRTAPRRTPVSHRPDKVLYDEARQKVWQLAMCFEAWHHNKIANKVTGWVM